MPSSAPEPRSGGAGGWRADARGGAADPVGAPLRLLDGVRYDGRELPGDRAGALLAALTLAGGRPVSETALVDEVWDDPPGNPAKALQVLVSRTRAATDPELVVRTEHGYRLGRPDRVDATRLRAALELATELLADDPAGARADAERADVPVAAADGEGPLARLRRTAQEQVRAARVVLGRSLAALGEDAEAVPVLEDAVAADPADESLLAALLRSEAAVRGVAAALDRYERYRADLAERLGSDPGPTLQAMYAELLVRDRPVRAGLAYDASDLVGRDADVAALATLVRTRRLVSIVGAGGLGKTRLANAVGRVADQPVVHLVELAGVGVPEAVPGEVAAALGARESLASLRLAGPARRADQVQRIVDQVGLTPTLLVLDNCEHLLEPVADLVALLLARTPRLHVLTTSRAPLGLAAERVYLLPELSTADAARLFEDRARAARPGVRLDPDEVRRLVARLDGLPLAVELAAAKVRVLAVAEIERRLDDRFALLRGGGRDAPERHRTLEAVIDWSWALLTDDQRAVLRRLAVFRDGFDLAGAEAVAGDRDVLDHLTALVEQSLVVVHEGETVRYRMLETVREFGRDRLAEAGEAEATETRLRAWADTLAEDAVSRLHGPDQVQVMGAVQAEEGNLLDVLGRVLRPEVLGPGTSDPEAAGLAAVLVSLVSIVWTIRGDHLRVLGLVQPVEELLAVTPVPPGREGWLRSALASVVTASSFFTPRPSPQALARLTELGPGTDDPAVRAQVRVVLALVAIPSYDSPELLDVLATLGTDPEPLTRRLALQWSAQALENLGRVDDAIAASQAALAVPLERVGPWTDALMLTQLADLAAHQGRYELARGYAERAIPVMGRLGAFDDVAQLRGVLALADLVAGELAAAERRLTEIESLESNASLFGGALIALVVGAEVQLARGEKAAGLAAYRRGVAALAERTMPGLGLDMPAGLEPWVLYPTAGAVAAHALVGGHEAGRALAAGLAQDARAAVDVDLRAFLDYPVIGSVAGARGLNQTIPSLRLTGLERVAEARLPGRLAAARATLGDRAAVTLRPDLRRLFEACRIRGT